MFGMTKHRNTLPEPTMVTSARGLEALLARLMAQPMVAVDTESNSLYAYHERVCLIQFSIPGEDCLLDPLAVKDLSPLGALFSDPKTEKIFHAAEYDVMVMRRDFGFTFHNLFDTMLASRIVGWPRYGLGSLLEEQFDIQTDKRMQRTNWGRRPLSRAELEYAQLDTHYLIELRSLLVEELAVKGRLTEARGAFERVTQSTWTARPFDPDGFWRLKGARDLDPTGQAVLRALYIYRDRRAQAMDRPPFKVFGDRVLIALSQARPRSLSALSQIKGIPRRLPIKGQKKLLSVIRRGMHDDPPQRARRTNHHRWDEATQERYETLREWRKQRAGRRGVESDVILSNRALHVLARRHPSTIQALEDCDTLNDWERQEYGDEIIALLHQTENKESQP
jgi:ribonuclease D